jgi:hypothetical protein
MQHREYDWSAQRGRGPLVAVAGRGRRHRQPPAHDHRPGGRAGGRARGPAVAPVKWGHRAGGHDQGDVAVCGAAPAGGPRCSLRPGVLGRAAALFLVDQDPVGVALQAVQVAASLGAIGPCFLAVLHGGRVQGPSLRAGRLRSQAPPTPCYGWCYGWSRAGAATGHPYVWCRLQYAQVNAPSGAGSAAHPAADPAPYRGEGTRPTGTAHSVRWISSIRAGLPA